MDPFLVRALAAGLGLAVVSAPLGCVVVWRRMAYFGETVAQASLIGIGLGLLLQVDLTASALAAALLTAGGLILLSRQRMLPLDTILGLTAHAALAAGVIATTLARGPSVDLMGYLFGDIFAVTAGDLVWVAVGGVVVLGTVLWAWDPLLATATHEELAAAEGFEPERVKALFVVVLALTIAVAMKIVGVLLAIAFLIMPPAAARPLASTPEQMALFAALIAALSVAAGLALSIEFDAPGGPSIVVMMALAAVVSLSVGARKRA
jgi:zinc transport system permease protein